jgi:hypothetical protein
MPDRLSFRSFLRRSRTQRGISTLRQAWASSAPPTDEIPRRSAPRNDIFVKTTILRACSTGRRTQDTGADEPSSWLTASLGAATACGSGFRSGRRRRGSSSSAGLGRVSGQERGKGPETARVGCASQKAKGKCQKSKCPGGDGCQEPGDLRTQAVERNNVAKTTILHEPDTESETEPYGQVRILL